MEYFQKNNMIMKNIKYLILFVSAMMLSMLTSCSIFKKTQSSENNKAVVETQRSASDNEVFRTLTIEKASFKLLLAGTVMNSSGTIKIARDSVIICSIMPMPGMEFFRFVVNKKGVLLINRVDKKYVEVSYDEMESKGIALNYRAFEAMFTNRLFLYGKDYFPVASDFNVADHSNGSLQLVRTDEDVLQEFVFNANKQLVSGVLSVGSTYASHWKYGDFMPVGSVSFPHDIDLTIQSGVISRTIGVHIEKLSLDKDRNFDVKIPATYKQITMKEFLETY